MSDFQQKKSILYGALVLTFLGCGETYKITGQNPSWNISAPPTTDSTASFLSNTAAKTGTEQSSQGISTMHQSSSLLEKSEGKSPLVVSKEEKNPCERNRVGMGLQLTAVPVHLEELRPRENSGELIKESIKSTLEVTCLGVMKKNEETNDTNSEENKKEEAN